MRLWKLERTDHEAIRRAPRACYPLRRRGQDRLRALEKLLTYLRDAGVKGWVPCGSTGEYNAMTAEERVSVLRFVKEFADKQETPIAGTNAGSTSDHADLQFGVWSAKWGQDEVVNQYSHLAIEKSEVIRPQAVFDANQAPADCEACLALLAQTLPKSGSRLMSLKQWTFIQAFKVGEAAAIAPVEYARLLYAAVIGIVFFAEVPSLWTLGGAGIVIASTLYTL